MNTNPNDLAVAIVHQAMAHSLLEERAKVIDTLAAKNQELQSAVDALAADRQKAKADYEATVADLRAKLDLCADGFVWANVDAMVNRAKAIIAERVPPAPKPAEG